MNLLKEFYVKRPKKIEVKPTLSQNECRRSRSRSPPRSSLLKNRAENMTEENAFISRMLKSWAKLKCDKNEWDNIQSLMDDIIINSEISCNNQWRCNIICYCGSSIKLIKASSTSRAAEKWTYGNFYKHFLRHLHSKSTLKSTKTSCSSQNVRPITEFLVTNPTSNPNPKDEKPREKHVNCQATIRKKSK